MEQLNNYCNWCKHLKSCLGTEIHSFTHPLVLYSADVQLYLKTPSCLLERAVGAEMTFSLCETPCRPFVCVHLSLLLNVACSSVLHPFFLKVTLTVEEPPVKFQSYHFDIHQTYRHLLRPRSQHKLLKNCEELFRIHEIVIKNAHAVFTVQYFICSTLWILQ